MRKIVYVKWLDHTSDVSMEWLNIAETASLEPAIIETVGFMLEDNVMYVTLGMSLETDSVSGRYTILKSDIVEMNELGELDIG